MNFLEDIENLASIYLNEAGLNYKHKKKGETPFEKTDGTEFHIQTILEKFAEANKITKQEAQQYFDLKKQEAIDNMKKSMKINGTMIDNIGESIAFEMLESIEIEDIKFNKRTFLDLFEKVKYEVPEFYPLSNSFEPRRIEPKIVFVPDPLSPEYASVGTAACTPTATLIFNVPFLENLMKFSNIKGLKANPNFLHGQKYVSQGGDIPDEYLYCEFVLLHEIMHYANGDFFFEKAFNLNGKLVNYVGDFITNYNLVKSGYAQLPIGLFNDEINYDRYNSYQEMYNVVEEEMKRLSDEEKEKMMDQLDQLGDEMPDEGEGADPENKNGQPQDGQPQDGQPQDGQPQDGQPQDGQPQDGQPQDGQNGSGDGEKSDDKQDGQNGSGDGEKSDDKQDGQNGSGDGEKSKEELDKEAQEAEKRAKEREEAENEGKTSGTVPKSIDDAIKQNQQMQQKGQEDLGRETKPGMNKDGMQPGDISNIMKGNNNGGPLSADGNPYALPERQYKPKLNWKQMLKKMIPSGTDKDETYTKPSRRTTSSMVSIAQTGSGVVKPGIKENPSDKKGLCFVLDESGSTMGAIGEMKSAILKLMEKNAKQLNGIMYIIKFSNDVHLFKVDVKKKKYGRVTNIQEFIKTGKSDIKCTKNALELFKSTYGGGTNLNSKIANIVIKMKTQLNFNTVIFSDTDIAYGDNAQTLKRMYKQLGPKAFALIGTDLEDYKAFVKLLGDKKNITHF